MVIHTGKTAASSVSVIIETKRPSNKTEMISQNNLNVKSLHELIFYYLEERIVNKNIELKHLIITNSYEWYIFEAEKFERMFFQHFKKSFAQFKEKGLILNTTDFFYNEVIRPELDEMDLSELEYTLINLSDYKNSAFSENENLHRKLIPLYKIFSPEHLLKKPFENDSNSLNKKFYSELLYILGLEEDKIGNKKMIGRFSPNKRNPGSFLENTIDRLESLDKVHQLKNTRKYGSEKEEILFNASMELIITWINRILFLKLLEGQLKTFNNSDEYLFMNKEYLKTFNDFDTLFFKVLAHKEEYRSPEVKQFSFVPYLNSSLFEQSEIEHQGLFISQLNEQTVPYYTNTVLKNGNGKKKTGSTGIIEYLLDFLDAYDFGSENAVEDIKKERKTIINASVLGLIFEKINGYQDGSFFTSGYVTMYMSRNVTYRTVVAKFNEKYGWKATNFKELYNHVARLNLQEANEVINSLTICDPAVGSGHFLVSILNELIALKSRLGILKDSNGYLIRGVEITVENDELIVLNDDGSVFRYNRTNEFSQNLQETLFNEKKTLIENCLFGVDINPNSVNICKLRLWIELLKNAYYLEGTNHLRTLPNIDINIKTGNSLISQFDLDSTIHSFTKKSTIKVHDYLELVTQYRDESNKEKKRKLVQLIEEFKNNFRTQLTESIPIILNRNELQNELDFLKNQFSLFEETRAQRKEKQKRINELTTKLERIKSTIEDIRTNKLYDNAFEWRFEFPEVLNEKGNFVGFDIIIGNPPYIYRNVDLKLERPYFKQKYQVTEGNFDLYKFFIERANELTKRNGYTCLITNWSFISQQSFSKTRKYILQNSKLIEILPLGAGVFEEATVDTAIYTTKKRKLKETTREEVSIKIPFNNKVLDQGTKYRVPIGRFYKNERYTFDIFLNNEEYEIFNKLDQNFPKLKTIYEIGVGINTGYIKEELTSDIPLDNRYHAMVPGNGLHRYGEVQTSGFIMYDPEYVKSRGKLGRSLPEERFFNQEKILLVRTRNVVLKRRIVATIDSDKKYNLNRLSNIISKDGRNLYHLLGILNSELYNWIFRKRFFDSEIKPNYLKVSPVTEEDDDLLIDLVQQRMKTHKEEDIVAIEEAINSRVYELFNLTQVEIETIHEGLS
ncbi:Eco57I restriction-modification methylase domain-containing protein [Planococcus rifietoensis]|uniref:type IIG restriction enzyme/methyltransferase n=1 Tax=Planococcus rifietoensis TaxID=200991 RepID=UPI00384F3262